MEMKLITYGKSKFEIDKFQNIKNRKFIKPNGGLWASPVDAKYGWHQWRLDNDFHVADLDTYFTFSIDGNVLVIDCLTRAKSIPWIKEFKYLMYPDYEKLLQLGYDAVYLTANGERETRLANEYSLYGWDCESVLIMNPGIVIP